MTLVEALTEEEFTPALEAATAAGADGLIVIGDSLFSREPAANLVRSSGQARARLGWRRKGPAAMEADDLLVGTDRSWVRTATARRVHW